MKSFFNSFILILLGLLKIFYFNNQFILKFIFGVNNYFRYLFIY